VEFVESWFVVEVYLTVGQLKMTSEQRFQFTEMSLVCFVLKFTSEIKFSVI